MAYQEQRLKAGPNMDILLIGKSGHGKSSTGNSILGSKDFNALGGGGSVTKKYQVGFTRIDERDIKVVDIPGLCDTSCTSQEERVDLVVDSIATGLRLFPGGFSALLLVFSFTARIAEEEKDVLVTLRSILGRDVIRKHTVCVFTHGDSFKNDFENTTTTFKTWCRNDVGYRDILEECEWRCVLFDNLTRDPEEKKAQLVELVTNIDKIRERQHTYTLTNFISAGQTREELKFVLKMPLIEARVSEEIGRIEQKLMTLVNADIGDALNDFNILQNRACNLKSNLPRSNHRIVLQLNNKIDGLQIRIAMQKDMMIERERERQRRRVMLEKHKAEMRRLQMEATRRQQQEDRMDSMIRLTLRQRQQQLEREEDDSCVIL